MTTPSNQQTEHLTRYVADFICNARLADLPADVVALGKKSILDGLGLALSGSATHSGQTGAQAPRRAAPRRGPRDRDRHPT